MATAPVAELEAYRDEADRFIAALDEEYYLHFAGLKEEFELSPIYERFSDLTTLDACRRLAASAEIEGRGARVAFAEQEAENAATTGERLSASATGDIASYDPAKTWGHEERRRRKLLVNAKQLSRLWNATAREGMTIVPLVMYFNDRGRVKLKIAVAKGKKLHDKRATEAARDWSREKGRLLKGDVR